jgi:tRNA pseudouridine55 synthase
VEVTVRRLDLLEAGGDRVTVEIECSAGFYVRSLAHDLGRALGIGAHLAALVRVASGSLRRDDAIHLERVEEDPATARSMIVPLALMLPNLPACRLTSAGVGRVGHGQDLRPVDFEAQPVHGNAPFLRLLDPAGDLVGVGRPARTPGLLHPLIVLM